MATFEQACAVLAGVLDGPARARIAEQAAHAGTLAPALLALRGPMRAHAWKIGPRPFDLSRVVEKFDRKTRQNGFHVLNDWDGIGDKVNPEIIPVDVLDYLADKRGAERAEPAVLATLIDYYFLHLLALFAVRVWDEGDADANLDRLDTLLGLLQGTHGSGQRFAADAETLLLIATSHYELHERGYGALLEQVRTLGRAHRLRIALGHAASMGSHLRFGFEATYGRDTSNMRDDNVADYPWLCFALATLLEDYLDPQPLVDRRLAAEALLNGLCADARAFLGAAPASLAASARERETFRDAFVAHRDELLAAFEPHRPSADWYSPLAFFFNFSHNVVKGAVVDALLAGRPWGLTLNDLLTGLPRDEPASRDKVALATTLMGYARDNPHRIRGRLRPVIVYDVPSGREAFSVALRKLREN